MASAYTPTYRDIPKASKLAKLTWTPGDLRAPWRDQAACVNYSRDSETPGDFTDEYKADSLERGRELCRTCPVALECLTDALADAKAGGKPQGLRGGFYFVMGGLDEESQNMVTKVYRTKSKATPSSH